MRLISYKGQEPIENLIRWSVAVKQHVNVPWPSIVKEYNTFIGVVDLHDMLIQLYQTKIKGHWFYLIIIFHVINMSCVNAWLLYRRQCDHKTEILDFVCDIAASLLKRGTEPRKREHPTDSPKPGLSKKRRMEKAPCPLADVRYDCVGNWPEHLPDKSKCKLCFN